MSTVNDGNKDRDNNDNDDSVVEESESAAAAAISNSNSNSTSKSSPSQSKSKSQPKTIRLSLSLGKSSSSVSQSLSTSEKEKLTSPTAKTISGANNNTTASNMNTASVSNNSSNSTGSRLSLRLPSSSAIAPSSSSNNKDDSGTANTTNTDNSNLNNVNNNASNNAKPRRSPILIISNKSNASNQTNNFNNNNATSTGAGNPSSSSSSTTTTRHFDKTPSIPYQSILSTFSTVNQVQIHHQSSNLHFCYNNYNHNGKQKWFYQGSTTLYLTLDHNDNHNNHHEKNKDTKNNHDNNNNQMKEIALHLRHGQSITITNTKAYTATNTTIGTTTNQSNTTNTTLLPLSNGNVSYFDPLHKIYTKASNTFTENEYIMDNNVNNNTRTKRYECDGYSAITGGGCSFMEEIRCSSIASNFGEMRIQVACPTSSGSNNSVSDDHEHIKEMWKQDLLHCSSDEIIDNNNNIDSNGDISSKGQLELELIRKCVERSQKRRNERIDLIANRLATADLSIFSLTSSSSSTIATTSSSTSTASAVSNKKKKENNHDNNTKGKGISIKLVIDFQIHPIEEGSHHFGGIHFHSPPSSTKANITTTNQTPHVYTTSGIIGDNLGPRCYIPTIDSLSIKHRFSHELVVKVTSDKDEGLWIGGCGEHYGVNGTVIHSIPRATTKIATNNKNENEPMDICESGFDNVNNNNNNNNHNFISSPEEEEKTIKEEGMMKLILGKASFDFIAQSFSHPLSMATIPNQQSSVGVVNAPIHVIPSDEYVASTIYHSKYQLATSIWTSSIWSPCPVRSIGFAIGPFKVLYDPEYYGEQKDDEDDDEETEKDDDDENEGKSNEKDDDDDDDFPTISETAVIKGEGIRQLYLAPQFERCQIHSDSAVITFGGLIHASAAQKYGYYVDPVGSVPSSASMRLQKKQHILAIMGATAGVTNRSLSLMRDILALPSYRTMSYTQIWIPNAVDGGSSCGALHSCPEVSCNPFLGGAIIDSTILPPLGRRLPFHFGGRSLQFLQARCAVRGWIRAALPLGGTDEIGNSYIHVLFEEFIMSLYERSHGAYGEGGSKQSFFFTKRFAIGSGLNSRNLDFLPVHNVEEEDYFNFELGGVVGALPAGKLGRVHFLNIE